MDSFHIQPGKLAGEIMIPPSKSHTLRALVFALMAKGKSIIRHPLYSPDTQAMIEAISIFGAKVSVFPYHLEILGVAGKLPAAEDVIHAGNSGQVLRFIGALAALSPSYTVITGDPSIRHHRPVKPLLEALNQLGAVAVSARGDGHAPIIIRGPLQGYHAALCGEDSQPVSALLIAASFLPHATTLTVTNPGEKPWIDMTLYWLKKFGLNIRHHQYEHYEIPGHLAYEGFDIAIPG